MSAASSTAAMPPLPDLVDAADPSTYQLVDAQWRHFGRIVRFCGQAHTIQCHEDNILIHEALKSEGKARVLVVQGGGSLRRALLGDVLATHGIKNGWAGIVISGAVRDVEALASLDIGVCALGTSPVRCAKNGDGAVDVELHMHGARVRPGDWVYVDHEGVVVAATDLR